jgi:hypothetical protein
MRGMSTRGFELWLAGEALRATGDVDAVVADPLEIVRDLERRGDEAQVTASGCWSASRPMQRSSISISSRSIACRRRTLPRRAQCRGARERESTSG